MAGRLLWLAARVFIAAFCWATVLYACVASSAFAYLQFLKPRVFRSVGVFSDWHPALFWIWCAVLVLALLPDLRRRRGRYARATMVLAGGLIACAVLAGLANTIDPVLPSLSDGPRSAMIGVLALVPILWLALIDHLVAAAVLRTSGPGHSDAHLRAVEGRMLVSSIGAALLVAVVYGALASLSIARAFEPDLLTSGLALGIGMSLLDQSLIFLAVFLVLAVLGRIGRSGFLLHYLLLLGALSVAGTWMSASVLRESIGLIGAPARVAAVTIGLSIAGFWGGIALRRALRTGDALTSAVDVFVFPPPSGGLDRRSVVGLVLLVPLACALFLLAGRIDWDFLLLNSGVVIVWACAFVVVCKATPLQPRLGNWTLVTLCAVPLIACGAIEVSSGARHHVLDRYGVHNPAFRLADGLVRSRPEAPSFERYLRAHTGLTDVSVSPISIDFVQPLAASPDLKPLIFLFVIDSLRPDYLSPYNAEVQFTPNIAKFARENLRFANAYTRYGGTGLSMPAIWAGSAIAHKQYVLPFSSMNALEKLVDANGYRRVFSRDHITEALWSDAAAAIDLDSGRSEMDFDFCRTLDELGATLSSGVADSAPVFAQTRSLNLHVAAVRGGYVPPGKSYPGFEAPYAWRVERMDGCFGRFLEELRSLKLYDRSLIVLTADHGELIGEDGRWGHSYHMFPEVIQIPLMMHLPSVGPANVADLDRLALSTDITPTIYAALGYRPVAANDLMGTSLLDQTDNVSTLRRRSSYVLAASYGAVYAVVSQNGRRLYIADAIKGGDRAYRRDAETKWTEITASPGIRMSGQLQIRRYVDELARLYELDQRF